MKAMPFTLPAYTLSPSIHLVDATAHADTLGSLLADMEPWTSHERTQSEMAARFRKTDPSAGRFAILHDEAIVGAVIVRYPFLRGAYLETLGLSETSRGYGIARAIIDWMSTEIAGEATNLWLCVTDWNTSARAVYRRLGFEEVAQLPDLSMEGMTEIFMRKTL
jgi:ribosomal protein S18 acetylase RimI-like enzyme